MTLSNTAVPQHTQSPLVRTEVREGTGVITLNRADSLNALNLEMMEALTHALMNWAQDSTIERVVVRGEGRAFCAGGDVRSFYEAKKNSSLLTDTLFRTEYKLNHRIHEFQKPYVSLLHGAAMGGGLGISIHGSHRLVTDSSKLAMPETTIGFFPDVGASKFLNKCPKPVGLYLALTGSHINAADALWCGLATHYVPETHWETLQTRLTQGEDLETVLEDLSAAPEKEGPVQTSFDAIKTFFSASTLKDLLEGLKTNPSDFAKETLKTLEAKSPTSLAITFEQLQRTQNLSSFADIMALEFRLSQRFAAESDFAEGVRALLVDKDKNPQWSPASLDDLSQGEIDSYFSPLDDKVELWD
ncbi:MAG: enoyl-CoA hydratase/isomerase family protein [bacterium]|nr:enoyl-CoA hydratase/isomerase family protein [bacterium]